MAIRLNRDPLRPTPVLSLLRRPGARRKRKRSRLAGTSTAHRPSVVCLASLSAASRNFAYPALEPLGRFAPSILDADAASWGQLPRGFGRGRGVAQSTRTP